MTESAIGFLNGVGFASALGLTMVRMDVSHAEFALLGMMVLAFTLVVVEVFVND